MNGSFILWEIITLPNIYSRYLSNSVPVFNIFNIFIKVLHVGTAYINYDNVRIIAKSLFFKNDIHARFKLEVASCTAFFL